MATLKELIARMPYRLRMRFDSLGSYVQSIVEENETDSPPRERITREELQTIQLVVFVRFLDFFLLEGTRAATHAVDEFAKLGISGFRIGLSLFEGRNENVMLGQTLSDALRQALDGIGEVQFTRRRDLNIKRLTTELMERAKNARAVD